MNQTAEQSGWVGGQQQTSHEESGQKLLLLSLRNLFCSQVHLFVKTSVFLAALAIKEPANLSCVQTAHLSWNDRTNFELGDVP